jgi:hypothetical protein
MTSKSNRRDFTRAQAQTRVTITTQDGAEVSGQARDVSLSGLFVQADTPVGNLPSGVACQVSVSLPGAAVPLSIHAAGRIVRSTNEGIAVEFCRVDEESMEHLRNLVRYNAADVAQVEEEIEDSVGLRRKKETLDDF